MNDRWHLAIHEAGHAVIGRVFCLGCGPASVVADDDSAGHSITPEPLDTVARWETLGIFHRGIRAVMRARIMTFMAGRVAEEELLGSCAGGDGADRRQVDLMLGMMLPRDADLVAYAARLERNLRPVVRRHRADIERVARSLRRHGTRTQLQLDRLVVRASRRPKLVMSGVMPIL